MRYYSANLLTGQIMAELPSLQIDGQVERRLGTYKTGGFKLPILDKWTPADWQDLIRPWRVLLVITDDYDNILWAGIPETLTIGPDSVVDIDCVTPEKYFDKLYVGEFTFGQSDQTSEIAYDLVYYTTAQDGTNPEGMPLLLETPASGRKRDRTYYNDEDGRLLTRIQQLAEVIDGFDWTIEVRWASTGKSAVYMVFKTGYPYLGTITDTPDAVFEATTGIKTSVTDFSYQSLYGDGYYANRIEVAGDGQGADKPYSTPYGKFPPTPYPRITYRESYQGVIDEDTLNEKAQGLAAEMLNGRETVELTATINEYPTPADIALGDSVKVVINTDALTFEKVYRMIGYTIDYTAETWKPILYDNAQIMDEAGGDEDDE